MLRLCETFETIAVQRDRNSHVIELFLMALLAVSLGLAIYYAVTDRIYFARYYATEDGAVEYGTALFLFLGSVVLAGYAISATRLRSGALKSASLWLYSALFFFAAGEEISWGQRIFGIESSEFFLQNNYQAETTLHNLVIGDIHLAELVFGQLLSVILLTYLLILPFVYPRWGFAQRVVRTFAIPVPAKRHALAALIATIIISSIDAGRKWEVYELAFALIALSIFLNPQNPGFEMPGAMADMARKTSGATGTKATQN